MKNGHKKKEIANYTEELLKEKKKEYSFVLILKNVRRKKVIEILNRYKAKYILEIGCGLEPLFNYFDNFESYTIVEPSESLYKYAKKQVIGKLLNKKIKIIHGFIENVYKNLGKYDFIILSSLLHEVIKPKEILQVIYNICAEDTIFHVNVPNIFSLHNLIGYEMGIIENLFDLNETDIRFNRHTKFDKNLLTGMLTENGFEIIDYGSYFIKPFTNKQMEDLLKYDIINEKSIEGLEKIIKYFPEFGAEIYVNAKKR